MRRFMVMGRAATWWWASLAAVDAGWWAVVFFEPAAALWLLAALALGGVAVAGGAVMGTADTPWSEWRVALVMDLALLAPVVVGEAMRVQLVSGNGVPELGGFVLFPLTLLLLSALVVPLLGACAWLGRRLPQRAEPLSQALVWTAPPQWPAPPVHWTPPPGWAPPPQWPPPPPGWQWWQPERRSPASRLGFHLMGVLLVAGGLLAWYVVLLALVFTTAPCPPSDAGSPAVLHVGLSLTGVAVVAAAALWARRAHVRGHAWLPWVIVAGLLAVALGDAAVTVTAQSCPFTF